MKRNPRTELRSFTWNSGHCQSSTQLLPIISQNRVLYLLHTSWGVGTTMIVESWASTPSYPLVKGPKKTPVPQLYNECVCPSPKFYTSDLTPSAAVIENRSLRKYLEKKWGPSPRWGCDAVISVFIIPGIQRVSPPAFLSQGNSFPLFFSPSPLFLFFSTQFPPFLISLSLLLPHALLSSFLIPTSTLHLFWEGQLRTCW